MGLRRLLINNFYPLWVTRRSLCLLLSLHFFFKRGSFLFVVTFLLFIVLFSFLWSFSYFCEDFLGGDGGFMVDSFYLVMLFFIGGEALLFISFFWAWFHHKWCPNRELSFLILPFFLSKIRWKSIPLLNTLLLLSSAVTVTVVHHKVLSGGGRGLSYYFFTLFLARLFLGLQGVEYLRREARIRDSAYGGLFFTLTGFHGFHVLVGVIFLRISFVLLGNKILSRVKHLFFELAIYYYHFVDVVWLGLFLVVYCQFFSD